MATGRGIEYIGADGEPGILSGDVRSQQGVKVPTSWVEKYHPLRGRWIEDEARQRASYIATRQVLVPYLVPHRFEGDQKPGQLPRAHLGYGIGLNRSYLAEIMGHLRAATATYTWGPLMPGGEDAGTDLPQLGSIARQLWDAATKKGQSWRTFMERSLLEWILTSPGVLVLVDAPRAEVAPRTQRDAQRMGLRPNLRLVPWSWVEDFREGDHGLEYVRLLELLDERTPQNPDAGLTIQHVLYELGPAGNTVVGRFDKKGDRIGQELDLGTYEDRQGYPALPFVKAQYGEHPELDWLGSGLLQGMDDIVIDLFNLMSEIREGARDANFSLLLHRGPGHDLVKKLLKEGSRLISLGDDQNAMLERLTGDPAEVEAGLRLVEAALKAWAESAKRKAADAMERQSQRSGVSLQAEFQLDLKPLLVELAETLDDVESDVLFLAGQVAGQRPDQLADVGVERDTEFQLEEEDSRIARKVKEYVDTGLPLPAELKVRLAMHWIESLDLVDLDERTAEGATLRDLLEGQLQELADSSRRMATEAAANFGAFVGSKKPAPGSPVGGDGGEDGE